MLTLHCTVVVEINLCEWKLFARNLLLLAAWCIRHSFIIWKLQFFYGFYTRIVLKFWEMWKITFDQMRQFDSIFDKNWRPSFYQRPCRSCQICISNGLHFTANATVDIRLFFSINFEILFSRQLRVRITFKSYFYISFADGRLFLSYYWPSHSCLFF